RRTELVTRMSAMHRKLLRDLIHMRGQMIAVTLVLTCGIATYVTMRSSFLSLELAQSGYYSAFRFADVFAHVKRAPASVAAAISAIPGVMAVQTRVVMDVTLDVPGLAEPATGRLISIPERRVPMLNDLFLREGRYIEPGRRGEALISEAFAAANRLRVGDSLGAVMNGKWEQLHIVGIALSPEYIYEIRPSEVFPDNRRFGVLWMSRDVLEAAFNMKDAFNDVALTLSRGADPREVISRLDRILDRYGSTGAYDRSDQISFRFLTDELGELRAYGIILPTLFLCIVAFLLNILLSRLVGTQRTQVAVLKAFGYTSFEIGLHYVELALVAVTAGAIAGVGTGLWLASGMMNIYARYFHFPALRLQVDSRLILFALSIAAGSACFGAISAVRRAVALAPAEAMRPEPPASFRPGLVERIGLGLFLSPAARMIVRNLNRRPWRALFSALAVALSVAIVVSGRYAIDAVNRLVAIQFQQVQREDVTVVFQEPRPAAAAYDLANLAGVLQVEPYREVAVRLRRGHRSHRAGLLGLEPGDELRRLVDRNMNSIGLPPDGLILNEKLAGMLGARRGDFVTVEVLEGARPVRQVAVAALVDEPVGLGAYMDAAALHRLMREGGTISGAWLKVDTRIAPRLYSTLKRTPSISGVAVRDAMLASFWKTFGESIWISTAFLVGFASVIAFGIVYNGARIALSERGNELACLRVLGYTRPEVWRILMGEQSLLTLSAIPVGFLLGFALSLLLSRFFSRELFRLPLVVNTATYAFAALVVAAAAIFSGLAVAGRLRHMDLTEVLKSRE
ncbi:MAG TPA: FtsX-like permease family protein, partial [Bryobacteraceae bacterium]|nr:FtsX-like permease family protein [Bryobacteraceae bacterium]